LPPESVSVSAPGSVEQRKAPRKKVLLTAKVVYGGGTHVRDCTVRDISVTGARITLAQPQSIPDAVYLLDLVNRMAYDAEVVSQRAGGCGLKFAKITKLAEVPPELRFLKRIWLESAR
jgi:hypothetical protein